MINEQLKNVYAESKHAYSALNEYSRGLTAKWKPSGLLEGMDDIRSRNMAVLLENQAGQIKEELSTTSNSAGSEEWSGVALPLIRRAFGQELLTNEIMSVQPMNLPSGLVFYLDYKYNNTRNKFAQGTSVFGGSANAKFGTTDEAVNGLYGVGRFGYSFNELTASVSASVFTSATATWNRVEQDELLSASVAAGNVNVVTLPSGSLYHPDFDGVRSFRLSGSFHNVYDEYTRFDSVNETISFVISGSAGQNVKVFYYREAKDFDRGVFEDKDRQDLNIPQIDIQIKSEPIVATTRKLKATWTPELVQDLNAYHAVNAEDELSGIIQDYVVQEIDLEMIDMIYQRALTVDYWSAAVGVELDRNGNVISTTTTAAASAYTKNSWYQTIGSKIQGISNRIRTLTMRGGANFALISPEISTIVESIPGFNVDTAGDQNKFGGGVTRIGNLANRITFYVVPYMTGQRSIILGYRGERFLETGAVYSPYVPVMMLPLMYHPDNGTPTRILMTRYAKKMLRPEFFGRLIVTDYHGLL